MTDAIRQALEWYAAEAEALAKNTATGAHTQAVLASVTVLALDGGRKARAALSEQPATDVASVEHAARRRGLEMTDAAYRQLMKHAHRLAMDGHGELAQFLRDAMTDAQRYAWLRGNAVREKALGDKFIEFHCDFESWNDIDAAIDKARILAREAHKWWT